MFAIEAELLEIFGQWTYGKLRFWVGGRSIGDFDDTSDLAGSARWGRTFLSASGRRTRPDLDQVATAAVYDMLYGRFVIDITSPEPQLGKASSFEVWDRQTYVLDNVGESALRDKVSVIVVRRGDQKDRMIVNSFGDEQMFEVLLPPDFCDITIATYCSWVEQLRSPEVH